MIKVFGSNELVDRDQLLSQLRGDYAVACLDKIENMNGQIIAIDFSKGQWPDGHGEHIWYSTTDGQQTWFCELRTDDSCVSYAAMGYRWQTREQLIAEVIAEHEAWQIRQEEQRIAVEKQSTNLVKS